MRFLLVVAVSLLIIGCGESGQTASSASVSGIQCGHKLTPFGDNTVSTITVSLPASVVENSVDLPVSDTIANGVVQVSAKIETLSGQQVDRSGNVVYQYKNGKVTFVNTEIQESGGMVTVNPEEFEADFGKYPTVDCSLNF